MRLLLPDSWVFGTSDLETMTNPVNVSTTSAIIIAVDFLLTAVYLMLHKNQRPETDPSQQNTYQKDSTQACTDFISIPANGKSPLFIVVICRLTVADSIIAPA